MSDVFVLAIDLGSTFFKAAVYAIEADRDNIARAADDVATRSRGEVNETEGIPPAAISGETADAPTLIEVGIGRAPIACDFGPDGAATLPVARADEAFRAAIADALCAAAIDPAKICAIGITSQAQTSTVATADGRCEPFVSWQDTRAEHLDVPAWPDFAEHCSFHDRVAGLLVSHLMVRRDTPSSPGLKARDSGGYDIRFRLGGHVSIGADARLLPLPSYFALKLTGDDPDGNKSSAHLASNPHLVAHDKQPSDAPNAIALSGAAFVNRNFAAMTGLYSLFLDDWWPEALERSGVSAASLPMLLPLGGVAGTTASGAKTYGLPRGVPVILAGCDQTAGAFGAGLTPGDLLITLGTAQVPYRVLDTLPPTRPRVVRGLFADSLAYEMMADSAGGVTIDWAQHVLGFGDGDAFFAAASDAPPGCGGLVFDEDIDIGQGAWRNIGRHHDRRHLARSVVESLVGRMAALVATLCGDSSPSRILIAGGGSRFGLWVDLIAAALPTQVSVTATSPLLGAARMACRAQVSRSSAR